jgi:hypothetical protein
MRTPWFWYLVVIVVVLTTTISYGEEEAVTLAFNPTPIALVPGSQGRTQLVLHNGSNRVLEDIEVTWFSNQEVEVISLLEAVDVLASGAAHRWDIDVVLHPNTAEIASVYFRASYVYYQDATSTRTDASVAAILEITPASTLRVEELIDIQVKRVEQALNEQQPGMLYLLVENKTFLDIEIQSVSVSGPDFVVLSPQLPSLPYTLTTNNTLIIPVNLMPSDVVQPGQHLILSDIAIRWEVGRQQYHGNRVVAHTIDVGVFGVSEILQALAIPSFLLLPGFLMVTTFGLLWRITKQNEAIPLTIGQADFWMVSITLSLLMAIIYPALSVSLTGRQRDYLGGYGLADVMQVWIWSILIGVLAYIIIMGGVALTRRTSHQLRQYQISRTTPSPHDTPLEILKKLHRQNLGLLLPRVRFKMNGQEVFAFIIEREEPEKPALWVAPMIELEWVGAVEPAVREAVNSQLVDTGSPLLLAQVLEEVHRKGYVLVKWSSIGVLNASYQIKREEIISREPDVVLVSQ